MSTDQFADNKMPVIDYESNMIDRLFLSQERGFKVVTAANGEQGLECALSKHFDCILCDLKMLGMDGVESLQ